MSYNKFFTYISPFFINRPILCQNYLSLEKLINYRNIYQTASNNSFWELTKKGRYNKETKVSRPKLIKEGFKHMKEEIQKWKEEVNESFDGDPIMTYRPGEVDIVFDFKNDQSLENWLVTCDSDNNEGFSHAKLETTTTGTALFSGELSTAVPKDGRIKKSGYCNMTSARPRKSFQRDIYYDWLAYTHLVIKCRGDGRSYGLVLSTEGYFDINWNDVYQFVLYTRGGPYWQISKIPFSKFFLCSKGRVQDRQHEIPLQRISNVGITVADKINGAFQLEIAQIGVVFDPCHKEKFAYEMYRLPKFIAST